MPRLSVVDPATATGERQKLLGRVERALGSTPNMMRSMAVSPAVLDAYLAFSGALAKGGLDAGVREQIALTAAAENACGYCAAAHSVLGARAGLSREALLAGLDGRADDPKIEAALTLARAVVRQKGLISDEELADARAAGLSDGDIGEVVANVALNVFTNYFNLVAQTELDFPAVELPARAA